MFGRSAKKQDGVSHSRHPTLVQLPNYQVTQLPNSRSPAAPQIPVLVGNLRTLIEVTERGLLKVSIALLAVGFKSVAADVDILAGLDIRTARYTILVPTLVATVPVIVMIPVAVPMVISTPVVASDIAAALQGSTVIHDSAVATVVIVERCPVPLAIPGLAVGLQRIAAGANIPAGLDIRSAWAAVLSVALPPVPVVPVTIRVAAPISAVVVTSG
jgi:hypothetical protein